MAQPISSEFIRAISDSKQEHIAKVEVLDIVTRQTLMTVRGVDDGSVSVDATRGTRRTMQLRLSNEDGFYTPSTSRSVFSYGNMVRIFRGLRYIHSETGQSTDEYVPVGTFMVDRPEIFAEKGMSVLTVDGSDLFKKIATGGFSSPYAASSGYHINDVIYRIAIDAGISPQWITLDPLTNRDNDSKVVGQPIQWEIGDSRADLVSTISQQFGIQIYFDPLGYLTSSEMPDPAVTQPVWRFSPGQDSILLGLTMTLSDANLINHIIVKGESAQGANVGVSYEIEDTDPSSPTWTGRIGDRTFLYIGSQITTVEQAEAAARKMFLEKCLIEETLKIPTLCLPQLEGNDVIEVVEPEFTMANTKYLCSRFDISLRDARMEIDAKRLRMMPA